MYCEDCHSDVPEGTIKCPYCGSYLTISKEKHAQKQAEEAKRDRRPLKWLIVVDVIALIVFIVGAIMMAISTAPKQVPVCDSRILPACEELGTVYEGDETTGTYLNGLKLVVIGFFVFLTSIISTIRGFIRAQVDAKIREKMEKKKKDHDG